jgi:DNA-binding response OmpR family regulator
MAKGRVLLVDTDPEALTTLAGGLRRAGYAVLTARDTVVATQLAVRDVPDVVITDLALPGGGGHRLAERLHEQATTAAVPVVFLAAQATEADYERARELGVARFLSKPIELSVIVAAVDGLIEQRTEAGRA